MASVQARLFSLVDGGKVVVGALLAVEELDDAHAGDVLLGEGVDLGGGGALGAVTDADELAEDVRREDDERDDGQGEQRQGPGHPEHDGDDINERDDVLEDGEDARGEHLVDGVDVRGDAGDEPADGVAVEEADVLVLDVAEDLPAEIEHDLLAGPLHEVGLDELEAEGDDERGDVETG